MMLAASREVLSALVKCGADMHQTDDLEYTALLITSQQRAQPDQLVGGVTTSAVLE